MSKTIAVIEDEPFIIEALQFLLEREGFVVMTHSDGAGAVEFIKSVNPDMVILDNMLPTISGMQILETVRASNTIATLPILMLTAKGQKKDRSAAEQAGASLFMTKPFANADLVANVRRMVGL
jgi:DNA-binding response OmpR family regulator